MCKFCEPQQHAHEEYVMTNVHYPNGRKPGQPRRKQVKETFCELVYKDLCDGIGSAELFIKGDILEVNVPMTNYNHCSSYEKIKISYCPFCRRDLRPKGLTSIDEDYGNVN